MSQITLMQGNCLEKLKELHDSSIDSIVTDPPYELGFMGKSWDSTGIANDKNMWAECLRVLKPGGHLLAFSGTRTYHRMAGAIEDAGFEVRDMIEWVYGCLSEDTEILTESGYKLLRKLTQYDKIAVYDITNNIYKWERPQRWSVYKVHQDTAYRIKSDYTDQIVSRNHRCLVEREGKLVFIQAEELSEMEYMPTLSEDFYSLQENSNRKLLLKELLWKGKGLAQKLFSKWKGNKKSEERIEVRKEPSLERWSNLLEETRKLQADKICEVSEGVFTDGEKRWICNGTSFDSGSILGDMFRESPSHTSYQSRPTRQQTGKSDVISVKQGTQITRRARVTKIEYSGIIFCPTVSTGAFVARRNGQVFITGNSGFPKSLNIGKAVDKLQGNEREELNERGGAIQKGSTNWQGQDRSDGKGSGFKEKFIETKGASEWEGWGTALKPAHEPICMARKPLAEKTVAENCLKYGTGGINIDESRVVTDDKLSIHKGNLFAGNSGIDTKESFEASGQSLGRFPANLCWSCDCDNNHLTGNALFDILSNISNQIKLCQLNNSTSNALNVEQKNNQQDTTSEEKKLCFAVENVDTLFLEKILGKTLEAIFSEDTECSVEMLEKSMNTSLSISLSGNEKMEEYQKVLKFITLTATKLITELKTCNLSQSQIIGNFITKVISGIQEQSRVKSHSQDCWVKECFPNESERFFKSIIYQAKASKSERNKGCEELEKGCIHPTVKPVALMEYLIKIVTPKGGTVLDPFMGSGSTGVACKKNGYDFIGIEMEAEYIKIAESRISNHIIQSDFYV